MLSTMSGHQKGIATGLTSTEPQLKHATVLLGAIQLNVAPIMLFLHQLRPKLMSKSTEV